MGKKRRKQQTTNGRTILYSSRKLTVYWKGSKLSGYLCLSFMLINLVIFTGIVPTMIKIIQSHQTKIMSDFKVVHDGIESVSFILQNYSADCSLGLNYQEELSHSLKNLVIAEENLGGYMSRPTYIAMHEFTYCYADVVALNSKDACNLNLIGSRDTDLWKENLLKHIESDMNKNTGPLQAAHGFFSRKSQYKYSIPSQPYGWCGGDKQLLKSPPNR